MRPAEPDGPARALTQTVAVIFAGVRPANGVVVLMRRLFPVFIATAALLAGLILFAFVKHGDTANTAPVPAAPVPAAGTSAR